MARTSIFDDLFISEFAHDAVLFGASRATVLDAIRYSDADELMIVRQQGRSDITLPELEAQLLDIEALLPVAENDSIIFDVYFRATPAGITRGKALKRSDLDGYPWAQEYANWGYIF